MMRISIFLFLFLSLIRPSFATMPEFPTIWTEPVTAYVVFPAGSMPDESGRFEIEVHFEVAYAIESLSLSVDHTEEITFDGVLPSFEGVLKAGESKVWRAKGTVRKLPEFEKLMPLLRISRTLGTIGFTIKRNIWQTEGKESFEKNLTLLQNLLRN